MNSELAPRQAAAPAPPPTFRIRLSSTRRGARLARSLAAQQLDAWGIAYRDPSAQAAASVVAELAANAATHGHSPGRDFELRLLLLPEAIRIEVSDTRPDLLPKVIAPVQTQDTEGGRGLLLVDAFATRWGCRPRDAYVKTVWAEVSR